MGTEEWDRVAGKHLWLRNHVSYEPAPDIQEEILFLPRTTQSRDAIKEAELRPIAKILDWNKQRQMWKQMKTTVPPQSVV